MWHPIEDLVRIPTTEAINCLNALHDCVCDNNSNVYVHCVAGWNRSPTVLWLYLVACGVDPAVAKNMIASSAFDAVPAHPKLTDDALVREVRTHGQNNFQPHPRPHSLDAPTVGTQAR
jgi:hypothetical protein